MAHTGKPVACPTLPFLAVVYQQTHRKHEKEGDYQCYNKSGNCCHVQTVTIFLQLAKIIEMNVLIFNSEVFKHIKYGFIHHWRSAEVVVDIFRGGMTFQVLI